MSQKLGESEAKIKQKLVESEAKMRQFGSVRHCINLKTYLTTLAIFETFTFAPF